MRKVLIVMGFIALLMPTVSFAGSSEGVLAILQPEDPIPNNAVKLKQISFTGNDYTKGCSYYELLLSAQDVATSLDANMMKVISRRNHSKSQICDEIEVAFYNVAQPRETEKTFHWNELRPLTWADFTGPIRSGSASRIAAETSCGIAIETNLVTSKNRAHVYVFNTFDKRTSWVKPGLERAEVLRHEQCHWDICELYTRKMQARFNSVIITGANLNRMVDQIYNEVTKEYVARQELFETETQHGTIPEQQDRWSRMIAQELGISIADRL